MRGKPKKGPLNLFLFQPDPSAEYLTERDFKTHVLGNELFIPTKVYVVSLSIGIERFLGHRSQRLQWPIVITRCPASVVRRPSVVRPSVVRRPLDNLHFQLLLQNHLMDFDETWYGWSTQGPLQVLLFFGQIRSGADPGRDQNRSRGVPFFKELLLQTKRLQQQTECIAVI